MVIARNTFHSEPRATDRFHVDWQVRPVHVYRTPHILNLAFILNNTYMQYVDALDP